MVDSERAGKAGETFVFFATEGDGEFVILSIVDNLVVDGADRFNLVFLEQCKDVMAVGLAVAFVDDAETGVQACRDPVFKQFEEGEDDDGANDGCSADEEEADTEEDADDGCHPDGGGGGKPLDGEAGAHDDA